MTHNIESFTQDYTAFLAANITPTQARNRCAMVVGNYDYTDACYLNRARCFNQVGTRLIASLEEYLLRKYTSAENRIIARQYIDEIRKEL